MRPGSRRSDPAASGRRIARAVTPLHAVLLVLGLAGLLVLSACQGRSASGDGGGNLGDAWVSLVSISPSPPATGPAEITIALATSAGQPISGAHLQVEGDMSMAGMKPATGAMADAGNGRYVSRGFVFTMGGTWTITVSGTLPDGKRVNQTLAVPPVSGRADPGPHAAPPAAELAAAPADRLPARG